MRNGVSWIVASMTVPEMEAGRQVVPLPRGRRQTERVEVICQSPLFTTTLLLKGDLIMNCPNCGGDNVVHESKAMYYTHEGRAHAGGNVTGYFCKQCGTMLTGQQRSTDAELEERRSKPAIVLTEAQRAARREALTRLRSLNRLHREGGVVDGLAFQLEQRAEW
ncbi:type II toxin-antitoxin system MqsA family antitoxin [Duganella sp. CY15W]|uniref:type II toxin-antitoxin system MqsA family antitoxin n=1 Tax=Duganella sp. CY15W TaxID=2692172 RepID=UPI00136D2896|nr:type II toxin-antitoxin system MqsA family antitoxin [Duganella sp. CY15W]MYM32639.1 type II toxin-antitoxin system MqsA family antitoxin [Duganella sp. CY15W]